MCVRLVSTGEMSSSIATYHVSSTGACKSDFSTCNIRNGPYRATCQHKNERHGFAGISPPRGGRKADGTKPSYFLFQLQFYIDISGKKLFYKDNYILCMNQENIFSHFLKSFEINTFLIKKVK